MLQRQAEILFSNRGPMITWMKDLAKFSLIKMPFLPLKHLLLCSIRCLKSGGFKAWINYSLNHLNISILWLDIFVNTSLHSMHSPVSLRQLIEGDSEALISIPAAWWGLKIHRLPAKNTSCCVFVCLLITPVSVCFLVAVLFVFMPFGSVRVCLIRALVDVLKRCFLVKSCSLGVEGEQTGETLPR